MDASKTKKVTDFLATIGGGAAAGFVDTKFADKKVAGLAPGVIGGVVLAGIGLSGKAGKFAGPMLAAGEGMLAGEAYRMTAERTAASVTGVGFLGSRRRAAFQMGMGRGRAISQAELAAQLAALRAQGGKMGGLY